MNHPAVTTSPTSEPTVAKAANETVFEAILSGIVRGTYPSGTRLPPERELSRLLGASRPTLREALRRLSEWQLIEARRGSGVVVRDRMEWSIEVLPAYLKHAKPAANEPSLARVLIDLLSLRRSMIIEVSRIVAQRIPSGGTAAAREAAAQAWRVRHDPAQFPVADFESMRSLACAANFYPAVWLLNRIAGVYFEIASTVAVPNTAPDDYLAAYGQFFDALEAHDTERAIDVISRYLDRHDRRLMGLLEALA